MGDEKINWVWTGRDGGIFKIMKKAGNVFVTKNEQGAVTRLAIGDFDTSLRVSASMKDIGNDEFINQSDSGHHKKTNLFQNLKNERQIDTASKRTYFSQNKPRSTVGTLGFMAPEVLRAKNDSTPYGFKADSSFSLLPSFLLPPSPFSPPSSFPLPAFSPLPSLFLPPPFPLPASPFSLPSSFLLPSSPF